MGRTEALTSPANPLLKDVRRAIARGGLTEQGWMVAETFHLLEEALRSDVDIKVILVAESFRDRVCAPSGIRVATVETAVFQKLSDAVIALIEPPAWNLEQALSEQTLVVVLDGVQDPGNAGAIVRAAEAFGATGVLFMKGTASPCNPKTLRASAGSLFRVPFVHGADPRIVREALRDTTVYVAMPSGAEPVSDVDLRRKCALVIGSEGQGVSEQWRRGAAGVSIPTAGVESLNAAVAAGILLYEARRQRSTA